MGRIFSRKQRQALYIMADGKCEICGGPLPDNWHADHVHPYSKGGATDVLNGQALCPACNLSKGDRSMIATFPYTLRAWQTELEERYFNADQLNFLVVATPGSGKTIAALNLSHQLLLENDIETIVVVCPTDYLRMQWIEEADRAGIPLTSLDTDIRGNLAVPGDFVGIVTTYAQVANNATLLRRFLRQRRGMVIADEIHHCGDELSWGTGFEKAFKPAVRRLLLSGTPFRTDNNKIPFVNYIKTEVGYKSHADFAYGYGRALMERGVVRPIVFPTWDGVLAWKQGFELKTHTFGDDLPEEDARAALRTAVHPDGAWLRDVIRAADVQLDDIRNNQGHPDAAGLIVAADINAAKAIAQKVKEITGEVPAVATSDIDDAKEVIEQFRRSDSKWIVAVNMISEGVDIKRLRVGVYATNTATRVFFYQVIGRVIRWVKGIDRQTSYFYFPMYYKLVQYMKEVMDEIAHVIRNHEATWEMDRKASGAIAARFYQFVDAEAVEADTIYLDYAFSKSDLDAARRAFGHLPVAQTVSDAELAAMWYAARGEEPPKKSLPLATERRHISTHQLHKATRKQADEVAKKTAGLVVTLGLEPDYSTAIRRLHNAWGQANGYTKESSISDYHEKMSWLGQLYNELASGRHDVWQQLS